MLLKESILSSSDVDMLNIYFDGRTIRKGKTGVGVYAGNLLGALAKTKKARLNVLTLEDIQDLNDVNIKKTNISYENHPIGDLWEVFVLPFYLMKERVDIFCSPTFHLPIFTFGTKKIVTIHDIVMHRYPQTQPTAFRIYSKIYTMISAKLADAIMVSSESTKKDIMDTFKIKENKVHVIPGAAADIFKPIDKSILAEIRSKYSLPHKYILFVGSIEPRKNLFRFIQSYFKARTEHQIKHQLVICGGKGWLKEYERILGLIRELRIERDVIFLGYVSDDDLPAIYNLADLFVFPSLYEGFGLPPLEAMSCGCPVIASNTSSIPEVVGEAGVLFNPLNIEEMSEAICKVLTTDSLRNELIAKGLKRSSSFSWKKAADKILELYQGVAL